MSEDHDNYWQAVQDVAENVVAELIDAESDEDRDELLTRLVHDHTDQHDYVIRDDLQIHTLQFSQNPCAALFNGTLHGHHYTLQADRKQQRFTDQLENCNERTTEPDPPIRFLLRDGDDGAAWRRGSSIDQRIRVLVRRLRAEGHGPAIDALFDEHPNLISCPNGIHALV